MRQQTLTHPAERPDAHRDSADASGTKGLAVREDASETPGGIADSGYAAGNVLSRLLYRSSYMVSFGIVYPMMLVVHVVPKDNAIVHGLVDGATAARESAGGWGADSGAEDAVEEPAHEAEGAENGSPREGKPSAASNHRPKGARRRGATKATPKRSSRKR